jgi:uncharacterized protein with NRDE domain
MCLVLLAFRSHPNYKLILAANRDEYYDRPTAPAAFWEDAPHLLAGRDLQAGGTWLGITTTGRMAAITNYRDPAAIKTQAPSRGELPTRFLLGAEDPAAYIHWLDQRARAYNGFNILVGNPDDLHWYCNRANESRLLKPGIYGLSNGFLDSPWPKVNRGKRGLENCMSTEVESLPEALFRLLADRTIAHDHLLPDTGVGLQWERILSPIFITSPAYGTRSSTLLLVDSEDQVTFIEKSFDSKAEHTTSVTFQYPVRSSDDNAMNSQA